MGQRFTGSDGEKGYTYFYFDSESEVILRVSKDGYLPQNVPLPVGSIAHTKASPLKVALKRSPIGVYKGAIISTTYRWFNPLNMSLITFTVYAPSREYVTYTTNYRKSIGGGSENRTIYLDVHKNAFIDLTRGVDYSSTSNTSLIVDFWLDTEYWGNITFDYNVRDTTKFTEPSGMESNVMRTMAWILLILLSGILALFIRGSEEGLGDGKRGKTIFFAGLLLLAVVFIESFTTLLIIVCLYYSLTFLKKIYAE
jgi:hypothetical protein